MMERRGSARSADRNGRNSMCTQELPTIREIAEESLRAALRRREHGAGAVVPRTDPEWRQRADGVLTVRVVVPETREAARERQACADQKFLELTQDRRTERTRAVITIRGRTT